MPRSALEPEMPVSTAARSLSSESAATKLVPIWLITSSSMAEGRWSTTSRLT